MTCFNNETRSHIMRLDFNGVLLMKIVIMSDDQLRTFKGYW